MPTIPTYGGPHVGPAPLPNVRLDPSTPPGTFQKVTPDLTGPAAQLDEIAQKAKRDANQVAVTDADNQLASMQTALLYDPQHGALNQHGKNAFGAPETVQSAWQQHVGTVLNSLANDDQKRMVQQLAAQRGQQIQETVTRHVAGEMTAYDQSTTKAAIDNATNDAVASYGVDQKAVDFALAKQQAFVTDYAQRQGLSPEAAQQLVADTRSNTHSAIIKKLIAEGQDQSAESYYAAHKAEITGTDQVPLEQSLKVGSTLGAAQRLTDPILKDPSLSLTDARQKVKDATADSPLVRQSALDMVDREYASRETALIEQRRAASATLSTAIEQAGGNIDVVKRQNPDAWNALSEPERSGLRRYAMSLASGEAVQTDPATYYGLVKMAGDPSQRAKWLSTNLLQYTGDLSRSDLQSLMRQQASDKDGTPAPEPGLLTRYQRAEESLRAAGIDPDPKDMAGKQDVARYIQQVDAAVRSLEQNTGKRASDADVQQVADELLIRARVDGTSTWLGFGGPKVKRLYQFMPGEKAVADVPSTDRQQIIDAYRAARGRAPTEAEIAEQYQRLHPDAP